ncbi:MAG: RdgB/HAM1 family non-canonical purine NTP pyrophosphatase [Planctomycetes bacterium]|nr:RdgB/HAM1 family non-canonical purine NTP pyrophosphatase [Planctomycetota bacterium]MCC7170958.1 RdgB/HAM1 family non-canonical purine NTP pyrophosphatase [Planctomycetota bacterium]
MRLLLASNNAKKRAELVRILGRHGVLVVVPAEVGLAIDPVEDGMTFADNARKKALAFAAVTDLPVLADDSGLAVDALDGAPGVHSARFAGEPTDDARNRRLLLERMAGVPEGRRSARFVCALALARGDTVLAETSGACEGRILAAERGSGGFGYDPLFLDPGSGLTFAELDSSRKDALSHRGRALTHMVESLRRLGWIEGRAQ